MANASPRTDHLVPYQWPKGQSGNPEGGRLGRPNLTALLIDALNGTEIPGVILPPGMTAAQALAQAILGHAIKGDPQLIREILRRIDGPPPKTPPDDHGLAQLSDAELIAQIKGALAGSDPPQADPEITGSADVS